MEEMKLAVTQEKRKETIDKILKLIESEFNGIEVTGLFAKALLQDAIRTLEDRCYLVPLKHINIKH